MHITYSFSLISSFAVDSFLCSCIATSSRHYSTQGNSPHTTSCYDSCYILLSVLPVSRCLYHMNNMQVSSAERERERAQVIQESSEDIDAARQFLNKQCGITVLRSGRVAEALVVDHGLTMRKIKVKKEADLAAVLAQVGLDEEDVQLVLQAVKQVLLFVSISNLLLAISLTVILLSYLIISYAACL